MLKSRPTERPAAILLIDDHPLVRDGILSVLRTDPRFCPLLEADTAAAGIEILTTQRPDLVITDLRLPDASGIDVLQAIQPLRWQVYGMVLSAFHTNDDILLAVRAGARAFLPKTIASADLLQTIHCVLDGEPVLFNSLPAPLRERLNTKDLTARELEVLTLLGQGRSNREIAVVTRLSENTVKTHLRHIFAKLEVNNRSEAAAAAIRRGLVRQ